MTNYLTSPTQPRDRVSSRGDSSARGSGVLQMRQVTSLGALDALETDWRRLAPEGTAPFQTFAWNRAWFRHYRRDYDEMSVFVFFAAGRVTGIVPCYRLGREMRLAGDRICDFQDAIVENRGDGPGILRRIFEYARGRSLDLRFDMLSGRGVLWQSLETAGDGSEWLRYRRIVGPCPWFPLPKSADSFLDSLRHGQRKHVRRALRRCEEGLPGHGFAIRKGGELNPADFEEMGALHRRNQFRKCGRSGFEDPVYRDFLNEIADSPEVGLRFCELREGNGDLAAFDLGFVSGERFYAYIGAWDEPHGRCSPGVCLLFREVADLPRQGVRFYDFLRGDEEYKFNYATKSYPVYRVRIYPRTRFNEFRLALRRTLDRAKSLAKPRHRRLCRVLLEVKMALHRRRTTLPVERRPQETGSGASRG